MRGVFQRVRVTGVEVAALPPHDSVRYHSARSADLLLWLLLAALLLSQFSEVPYLGAALSITATVNYVFSAESIVRALAVLPRPRWVEVRSVIPAVASLAVMHLILFALVAWSLLWPTWEVLAQRFG